MPAEESATGDGRRERRLTPAGTPLASDPGVSPRGEKRSSIPSGTGAGADPSDSENSDDELIRVAGATCKRLCARKEKLHAQDRYLSSKDEARLHDARETLDRSRSRQIGGGGFRIQEASSRCRRSRQLRNHGAQQEVKDRGGGASRPRWSRCVETGTGASCVRHAGTSSSSAGEAAEARVKPTGTALRRIGIAVAHEGPAPAAARR